MDDKSFIEDLKRARDILKQNFSVDDVDIKEKMYVGEDSPILRVQLQPGYEGGETYSAPLVVSEVRVKGPDTPINDLADMLGDHADQVPNGTKIIEAHAYLPISSDGIAYTLTTSFPHNEAIHGVTLYSDGRQQRYHFVSNERTLEVSDIRGEGENIAAEPWNTANLPNVVDMEMGHGWGQMTIVVGHVPMPSEGVVIPHPNKDPNKTALIDIRGLGEVIQRQLPFGLYTPQDRGECRTIYNIKMLGI